MTTVMWEIPRFREVIYNQKSNRYALVVPVLNEGHRIINQLQKIQKLKLKVDVVIADGGSTDGTWDNYPIQDFNLRAILFKEGGGKLGAQLRIAYSWCLSQNYLGIITIDGNGKDDVKDIDLMIKKLDNGADYVQGSRYLKGGEAVNTPILRAFGNRYLHAPLLSLAGRIRYTDTTNGFRAYSSNYLLHDKVKPFRSEFVNYELLFYLTARAGQLGFKVEHVPVTRRYPVGKIPTKIVGIGANLSILKQVLLVVLGKFNP